MINKIKTFEEIMYELVEELAKKEKDHINTGFMELDKITGGFKPGELIIIAARPGMGKTSFALNIAKNVCTSHKVILFSLEMSRHSLGCRFLSSILKIPLKKMLNREIGDKDWDQINNYVKNISDFNFYVDDSSYINFDLIRDEVIKLGGIKMIIVDYLQLIETSYTLNRVMEISKLTRNFKNLARELNIPIVLLSQLSRACESRQDKRPTMSDLRDSGSIEQDADKVMLLYRPSYYCEKYDPEECEVIISKNRSGETGEINLIWKGQYSLFLEHIQNQNENKSEVENFKQIKF